MLGWRATQGKGAWPLHARIGNRVLAAELRRRVGVAVHDLGPMRAARREDLLALNLTDRRFGYPLEMVVRAAEAGWRIAETAVPYYPTGRQVEGHRHRPRHRADRQGHAPGPRLDHVGAGVGPGAGPGPRPGPGVRTHRAGHVVTADVYTGKHRREGALGAPGGLAPQAP